MTDLNVLEERILNLETIALRKMKTSAEDLDTQISYWRQRGNAGKVAELAVQKLKRKIAAGSV